MGNFVWQATLYMYRSSKTQSSTTTVFIVYTNVGQYQWASLDAAKDDGACLLCRSPDPGLPGSNDARRATLSCCVCLVSVPTHHLQNEQTIQPPTRGDVRVWPEGREWLAINYGTGTCTCTCTLLVVLYNCMYNIIFQTCKLHYMHESSVQPIPNLGESHPSACLGTPRYHQQKAEPPRCLALRTRGGRLNVHPPTSLC